MTAEEVNSLTEQRWAQMLVQRDGKLHSVPVSVSVEVGAFRFTSTQGLPKGLVRSVLDTRKRRPRKFTQPKCAELMTITGPRTGYGSKRRLEAMQRAQREAYDRAMAAGVWAA